MNQIKSIENYQKADFLYIEASIEASDTKKRKEN